MLYSLLFNINHSSILPLKALNSLYCADVPLSNYSLTHSIQQLWPFAAAPAVARDTRCFGEPCGVSRSVPSSSVAVGERTPSAVDGDLEPLCTATSPHQFPVDGMPVSAYVWCSPEPSSPGDVACAKNVTWDRGLSVFEFCSRFWCEKTRVVGLPGSEKSLTICLAVSTQYRRVTDRKMHQSIEHIWVPISRPL